MLDFNNLDNDVFFPEELEAITYSPADEKGYYTLDIFNNGKIIENFKLYWTGQFSEMTIIGIGQIIKSYLESNDKVNALFSVTLTTPSSKTKTCGFEAVKHSAAFGMPATGFLDSNFLTTAKCILIPVDDDNNFFSPTIYVYDKNNNTVNQDRYIRSTGVTQRETLTNDSLPGNIKSYKAALRYNNDLDPYLLLMGIRKLQIVMTHFSGGAAFLIQNEFGVPEYLFFPGIITDKLSRTYTSVSIFGESKAVDPDFEKEYTLKISNAPQWMYQSAQSLLRAYKVEYIEDPCAPLATGMNKPVIIKEVSGTFSDDPSKLSDISITFNFSTI